MTCLSCKPEYMEQMKARKDEISTYRCMLSELVKHMTDNETKLTWPYVRSYGILASEPNETVLLETYLHPALKKGEWRLAAKERAIEEGLEHLLAQQPVALALYSWSLLRSFNFRDLSRLCHDG
ncbi:hypothetical protein N7523_010288 [Penicillium sp. IBT 18751x]|nr:hypothetical protein N7523_010288 [Penicillium sp. IBT 18751x]